jgi:hypothetical protein
MVDNLRDIGIVIEKSHRNNNELILLTNRYETELLNNAGIEHEVLIEDMSDFFLKRYHSEKYLKSTLQKQMKNQYKIQGFKFGSMGGHYTYEEIVAELDSLNLKYTNLITSKISLGNSHEDRDIWMIKISDNPDIDEDEPQILFTALIHAREPMGMTSLMYCKSSKPFGIFV